MMMTAMVMYLYSRWAGLIQLFFQALTLCDVEGQGLFGADPSSSELSVGLLRVSASYCPGPVAKFYVNSGAYDR